jgi:hypothetical protein
MATTLHREQDYTHGTVVVPHQDTPMEPRETLESAKRRTKEMGIQPAPSLLDFLPNTREGWSKLALAVLLLLLVAIIFWLGVRK